MFIARGKEDALVTLNMVPGETVYGEKKVSIDTVSQLTLTHSDTHTHTHTHTYTHTHTHTHTHTAGGREEGIQSLEPIPQQTGGSHFGWY